MSTKGLKYDKIFKALGAKVNFYRKVKGLTQEELAYKINKTEDTISNIERGIFGVKIETLVDISEALEIELSELFTSATIKQNSKASKKIKNIITQISAQDEGTVSTISKIIDEVCNIIEHKSTKNN